MCTYILHPHTRRKVSGGSSKVKSKPLPPLKTWKGREEEEEEEEEMEMRELVTSTEEDKDDYYFEDPSNISKYIAAFSYSHILAICFTQ